MGYTKLSNNEYKIYVELGYDVLGKRRRKTRRFTGTYAEMKKVEAELTNKYYHVGNVANVKELTFEQYSEIFMKRYCENNLSLVTIQGYKDSLKRIIPIIGKVKLDKITPYMLDSMYSQLKIGTNGKVLSYHSMYAYRKIINLMLHQAVKWELLSVNPNDKTTKLKKEKKERRFYDLDQTNKLLNCLKNENIKYRALLTLTLDSGARRSEICALRWNDINFDTHMLKIDNSLKVVKGVMDEKTTKTNASKREIMISDETIEVLKQYKEWQDDYKKSLGNKWQGTNRVFISKYGDYMHPCTCEKILNKIVKKYDLDPITFHELRHTSASILITKGINPKAVSQRLGHSSTDVTMDIYSHVFDTTKKESACVFDEVIKNA